MLAALLVLPLLSAPDSPALIQPSPLPAQQTGCTWEGNLAGSGAIGQWTEQTTPESPTHLSTRLSYGAPEQWLGLLEQRFPGRTITLQSQNHEGLVQDRGPQRVSHDTFTFVTTVDGSASPSTITISTRVESTCAQRSVHPGDVWSCDERIIDTWSTDGGALGKDSGTTRFDTTVRYEYKENTTLESPVGRRRAALIEATDEDGMHQRQWVDLERPWCTLKLDRLKLDRVVGSHRLIAWEVPHPSRPAPAPTGNVTIGRWALGMLVGLALVFLLAWGVSWYAGRRNAA